MKTNLFAAILLAALLCLPGCRSIESAFNLSSCTYKYKSVSSLKLDGTDITDGASLLQIPRLLSVLQNPEKGSLPLDFTVNIDVYNPNTSPAAFQSMAYSIEIDRVKFVESGNFAQPFSVGAGDTATLPVPLRVDLAQLIRDNPSSAIAKIVQNFIGIGSEPSNVTLQLKPTVNVAGVAITSPSYFPVNFTFGGKKKQSRL